MSDIQLQLTDKLRHFGLTDSTATFAPSAPTFTDTVALSDVLTLLEAGFIDLPLEGLSISDARAIALGVQTILTDTFALNDNFDNYIVGIVLNLSDTLTFSDSTSFDGPGINLAFTDSLALSDAQKVVTGVNASFTENLTISDSIDPFAPDALAFSDTLALSDAVSVDDSTGAIAIAMTNTLTFSDSIRVVEGNELTASDTLSLLDIETALERGLLTVADQIALSDILKIIAPVAPVLPVKDRLLLTDEIDIKYGLHFDLDDDVIALLDAILVNLVTVDPQVSDSYVLSDSVALQLITAAIAKNDSLTLSDTATIQLAAQLRIVLADTLTLTDSTSAATFTDFIDYVRRYLNDVPSSSNVGS